MKIVSLTLAKKAAFSAALVLLASTVPVILRAQEPAVLLTQSELFVNATVIDGRGGPPRPESALLVWGGEIRAIGARDQLAVPEGTSVVDLEGAFVIPGLIDVFADPGDSADVARMLAAGVTGVREAHTGAATVGMHGRDPGGDGPAPVTYMGGALIGSGPDAAGISVSDVEAATREADRQVAGGARFLSLGTSVPEAWLAALARAGRRLDVPVWSDRTGAGWLTALRVGVDVASPLVSLDPALLPESERVGYAAALDADRNAAPTAWLERLPADGAEVDRAVGALLSRDASLVPLLAATEARLACSSGARTCEPSGGNESAELPAVWETVRAFVRTLHREGVRLLAGSDAPRSTTPGRGFHRELELLVDAGIPPLDVLSIATRNGAIALGVLHERGTLETGKKADFVVLKADPTANIENLTNISFVVLEGRAWGIDPVSGELERIRFR